MVKNSKAQTNQIFVYLLSIMIILFAGFLVTKFIISFSSDADSRQNSEVYSKMSNDFERVYTTYGSERVLTYIVSNKIENVCFVTKSSSCTLSNTGLNQASLDNLNVTFESGDNVALFSNKDLLGSGNIGKLYSTENDGCFCIKPKNNRIKYILNNNRNKVYLSSY